MDSLASVDFSSKNFIPKIIKCGYKCEKKIIKNKITTKYNYNNPENLNVIRIIKNKSL